MATKMFMLPTILSLALAACGNGLEDGSNLIVEQEFLVALRGKWIGPAESVHTVSGSDRMIMNLDLPDDGLPRIEGLSGAIKFGIDVEPVKVNPDDPGLTYEDHHGIILDGFVFDLEDMAIVSNRLMSRFRFMEQWLPFCEAQTEIYDWGNDHYNCMPGGSGWWGEGGGLVPEGYTLFHGPEGQEILMLNSKVDFCISTCVCDSTSCTIPENYLSRQTEIDVAVDIERGFMLGTMGSTRITAVKCEEGYHPDTSGNCVRDESCPIHDQCGKHSTCDDATGEIVCVCDEGYSGSECSVCAEGFHADSYGDCVANELCPEPDQCGVHRRCDDSTGDVVCVCAS